MKPKKIKARKMWAFAHLACYAQRLAALCYCKKPTPAYVLPADAASVEAMVEQMANGMHEASRGQSVMPYPQLARAALAAIGIKGGAK